MDLCVCHDMVILKYMTKPNNVVFMERLIIEIIIDRLNYVPTMSAMEAVTIGCWIKPTQHSWHWSFPTHGTPMDDGAIPLKHIPFSPLGVAGRQNTIADIGHSILRDPTGTFNTVLIIRIIPLNKRHYIK